MRKRAYIIFVILTFTIVNVVSQANESFITNLDGTVYTTFFIQSKQKVIDFTTQNNVTIISNKESEKDIYLQFYANKAEFEKFIELMPDLGFIERKEITTTNNSDRVQNIKLEIQYLKESKQAYQKELNEMSEKDDRYYNYWERLRNIDKDIFNKNKELTNYSTDIDYYVNFHLYDETVDLTVDQISWVNMPGASFDMLFTESPTPEISAEQYMGYSIKYLFTRGKSYATIGALKEYSTEISDPNRYKELFVFGFGQDWYSKYFGRGKNKFFNLYTGYNFGGTFGTGEDTKLLLFYLTPYLGIEIFKNKYILIDNRAGYYVPFSENRNLRGIMYSASFNFVF